MENVVEGIVLPIIFIIVVTIAAIIAIIASVETDNIENNQAIFMQDELLRANRYLIIGYILYFVSVALILVSIITHFTWNNAPAWLQTFLTLIAFIVMLIGVILVWIAYDNLRSISDDVKDHTLWALGLGLVGMVLALIIFFFRSSSYVREHTVNSVKEEMKKGKTEKKISDIGKSLPITTQSTDKTKIVTTTTRKLDTDYPMMI